jgi:hypothetical protein
MKEPKDNPAKNETLANPAKARGRWLATITLCTCILCFSALVVFSISGFHQAQHVRSEVPIGRVIQVVPRYVAFFDQGGVLVQTEKGIFPLHGKDAIAVDDALTLQTRGNGVQLVCHTHGQRCLRLARDSGKP